MTTHGKLAMSDAPLQLGFGHLNSLRASFKYVDRLLSEALAFLAPPTEGLVFPVVRPDATPVQRKVITDQVARLRRALGEALELCGIAAPEPDVGALWAVRTHLLTVEIALEDTEPGKLRGYGGLDDAVVARIAAVIAQIRVPLAEMTTYIDAGLGGDLSARLARLDQTTNEVRLLRELERIVTAHGLVEFRQSLAQLIERVERNWWTVAFVGRVSSGKSSLLNHLLGTDCLPSGVTPVTAVPVRIVPGAEPRATISFATEKRRRATLAELREFASEDGNPGNARHVTDITLELPAPRLEGDTCFVDTPGLGSLATAGAAQTLAFLPRCDLGVILIDGAVAPSEEDVAVARTLMENGAEVLVVLSKADLLAPADRAKAVAYVSRQFAAALGREVSVAPVSVMSGHEHLAASWYEAEMTSRAARHRELAAIASRRKVGAMREAVVIALTNRAGRHGEASLPSDGTGSDRSMIRPPPTPDRSSAIARARATMEGNRRRLFDLAFERVPRADAACVEIATAVTDAGDSDSSDAFDQVIARSLNTIAARFADAFDALLDEAREAAVRALDEIDEERGVDSTLPRRASRPLFDPTAVLIADAAPTSWRRWPSAAARRGALRRQLRTRYAAALDDAMRTYARGLVAWGERYVDDLASTFNAQAGFIEARTAPAPRIPSADDAALGEDLEMLRHWNDEVSEHVCPMRYEGGRRGPGSALCGPAERAVLGVPPNTCLGRDARGCRRDACAPRTDGIRDPKTREPAA